MNRLALVLVAFAMCLGLSGCGGGSESCSPGGSCPKGATWSACCTSSECRYTTSAGTTFPCSGTNCNAAAQQLATWCQGH